MIEWRESRRERSNANAGECGKRIDFSIAKDVTGGLKHRPVKFVGSL